MAQQTIVWTVLPHGRETEGPMAGRLRVSIIASPRLTPQSPGERRLAAFPDWLNWPKTLEQRKFQLRLGAQQVDIEPVSRADPDLWARLFNDNTPVAGFTFKDMSRVNLRSYAVRNVLGLARRHYARIAVESLGDHPTLVPWKDATGGLKDMLVQLGTRVEKVHFGNTSIDVMHPGFDRYYDDKNRASVERVLDAAVFNADSRYGGPRVGIGAGETGQPQPGGTFPMRVLPSEWQPNSPRPDEAALMQQWQSADEYTLYQADRFYRREPPTDAQRAMRRPTFIDVPPPPKLPDIDFHGRVASYSDYGGLLRRLGLVIDGVLPLDSPIDQMVSATGTAQGLMGLVVHGGAGHEPAGDSCPRTAWQADKRRFTTRPRSSDHERGMLKLRHTDDRWGPDKRSNFDVYQCDPDGTALKTVDFLLSAQRLVGKSFPSLERRDGSLTYTTGNQQALAALRSGGLGISRHGRAAAVAQSAASAALKHNAINAGAVASTQVVLFTEDVLRGYRVDVQPHAGDDAARWYSLCRRTGAYRLAGTPDAIDLPPDEGYVKGASTTSGASATSNPDDHYLHESLFRWAGWSLVAPRPGRTIRSKDDSATGVQGESVEDVTDEAPNATGIAASFTATKGSLPRLRFGMRYRMRARIVDLAGNSLDADDKSFQEDDNTTEPSGYWRFEPVDPPVLVQRARTSEGESLERMVIRSNGGVDPAAYLQTPDFVEAIAQPLSADFEYGPVAERHVVPPKASQLQCETHGVFDAMWANAGDIKQAYAIAAREAGTLYDAPAGAQVELITPTSVQNVATTPALPPRLPSPDNPTGDRLAPGQYVIHREAHVETPYLPDPAAGGTALRAMPGHTLPGVTQPQQLGEHAHLVLTPDQELVILIAHAKDWPDAQGFRVVLDEQPATLNTLPCQETLVPSPPKWDEAARELTLFVPKGRIVRLRYASFVHKDFLPSFGIPQWVDDAAARARLLAAANLGCAWTLTPYRKLTLVHATQQPICAPALIKLGAKRQRGDQHAMLDAHVHLHGPSSGKFEIEAAWKEVVDDLEKPRPGLIDSQGALGEVLLHENHDNQFGLSTAIQENVVDAQRPRAPGNRHDFGDTKFRLVAYRARATTRFREYLPPSLYDQLDKVTHLGPPAEGPAMQVGADDDFGAPVLPLPGSALHTVVLSSAPPDDPRVLYTLPTFRWQRSTATTTTSTTTMDVTRIGNGLRVWLERPWFSSGNGELLGVVLLPGGQKFEGMADQLQPFVSQWGMDPLWDTARPGEQIRATDFPSRVIDEALTLPLRDKLPTESAAPEAPVHVVGHRVRWNEERKLWYCDIDLDPGRAYMPFVRLALVRYQPHALPDAKLSKVVMGEFAQVLPKRRARLVREGSSLSFTLHGQAPAHGPMKSPQESPYQNISFTGPGAPQEDGRNRAELVLQFRDPGIDSDLAWSDVSVLQSSIVPQPATTTGPGRFGAVPVVRRDDTRRRTVTDRMGQRIDFERLVELGGATTPSAAADLTPSAAAGEVIVPVLIGPLLFDPLIWQATATLPPLTGQVARLALREYERYYTDRTVPEKRGDQTDRRRVIEERLVFTTFFDL